jgi:hypothetical protein
MRYTTMIRTGFIFFLLLSMLLAYSQSDSSNAERTSQEVIIPKYERTKGYVGWLEAGVNFLPMKGRNHADWFPSPSFYFFNGARLNRNITLGLELGIHPTTHISVNPKVRCNLYLKPRVALIFDFAAGYTYTFVDSYHKGHGFNFTPSVGFKVWGKKGKCAFTFRVGYNGIVTKERYFGPSLDSPQYNTQSSWPRYRNGVYAAIGLVF